MEVFFGMLNMTNSPGHHTQFFFGLEPEGNQAPVADLHFFPGQPRMLIGGLSWRF